MANFQSKFIRSVASLVWVALLLFPSAARAQFAGPKRVVVLYWYNKDYPWNINFDRTFQGALVLAGSEVFQMTLNIWDRIGFQEKTNLSYFVTTS